MLRKIRLTFAMICFVLITLLFLDFTGTLHGWFGWLAKIQFLPAVLALNVGVILFLVILTLVCGRIYCSVICPLGVFQDILAWLGRQPKKRRKLPYSYSPALSSHALRNRSTASRIASSVRFAYPRITVADAFPVASPT